MAEGTVAGVDWAWNTHEVLIADADGERLWAATVTHDEAGLSTPCSAMRSFGVQRLAIERPDGLLIDRLLDAGLTIIAIHPNKVDAARDRFRPAGGKPTGSTRSFPASSRAPTATASRSWSPTATRPRRSEP